MAKDGQGQVIVGRYDPGNMFHRDKITSPPVVIVEHNPVKCAWVKIGPEEGLWPKMFIFRELQKSDRLQTNATVPEPNSGTHIYSHGRKPKIR